MPSSSGANAAFDGALDERAIEASLQQRTPRRWRGWRLWVLALAALAGLLLVAAMVRVLAASPHLPSAWQATALGQPTLLTSPRPDLAAMSGRTLVAVESDGLPPLDADVWLLRRTARWLVDGAQRTRWQQQQRALASHLAQGRVRLRFSDDTWLDLDTPPRGYTHVPVVFWPIAGLALALYLVGVTVLLRRPGVGNALFGLMALAQALNLLLIASEPWRGLGIPPLLLAPDPDGRMLLDVLTAVAAVCAYALHPRPLRHAAVPILAALAAGVAWAQAALVPDAPALWAFTQATLIGLGLLQILVIGWSLRQHADPALSLVQRLAWLVLGTVVAVTLGVAATHRSGGTVSAAAAASAEVWYLFFASLLLLLPFVVRPRRVLREFALVAGIGSVTGPLALVFVAAFALGPVGALLLSVTLTGLVYFAARRWILEHMLGGGSALSAEHAFEQVYRTVRAAERQPELTARLLRRLLQELFDAREAVQLARHSKGARVLGAGRALSVPVPAPGTALTLDETLVMRHASQGQRIFTHEDALLAERLVEQVCRTLAHDRALEQGRSEERQRIAQDLHDDIGARLLTLMYKATDPEIEDYIRHTLQDLKTLTRGLAAGSQTLSEAAGEWKADLGQRLSAAGIELDWRLHEARELALGVVSWSALTRILRELVSNSIMHAQASRVIVELQVTHDEVQLVVSDNGRGGDPQAWVHGLGLAGVRKRARALGGQVRWTEAAGSGIRCEVRIPAPAAGEGKGGDRAVTP
ncbi:MAG TPA: ATP-binding protein [Rubrivivax sp.]|nr:ATP-binding protein [Rubrivivax sp.]